MALPAKNRLPLRFERGRLDKEGRKYFSPYFTIIVANSPVGVSVPRFAILLSKKTAAKAVERNLIKRRISAVLISLIPSIPLADYLIIPKRLVLEANLTNLQTDLASLLP